jgi:hypothetical protein
MICTEKYTMLDALEDLATILHRLRYEAGKETERGNIRLVAVALSVRPSRASKNSRTKPGKNASPPPTTPTPRSDSPGCGNS